MPLRDSGQATCVVSSKVVEPHEVRIESHHLRGQCPAPVAGHRHVRVDPRYPKSQPAHAGNPLIAEPVHIDRIEVRLARDEHDPGIRDRPQKRPDAARAPVPRVRHREAGASTWRYRRSPGPPEDGRDRRGTGRPEIPAARSRRCVSVGWLRLRWERSAKCPQSLPRVSMRNRSTARPPTTTELRLWRVLRSAGAGALHLLRRDRRRYCRRLLLRTRSVVPSGDHPPTNTPAAPSVVTC